MKIRQFFTNKKGELVIWQKPNIPLLVALFFILLSNLPISLLAEVSFWAGKISLLYWAYLEITAGDSMFRRGLGIVVFIAQFL